MPKDNSMSNSLTVLAIFSLALVGRLLFLFLVSGLGYNGWYHDSYHHWQIAYYTLHVGLKQVPPRMWDLNGMEYFWGLLPTLTESLLLWVFNTTSMVPFRVFNSIMGSLSACLISLLGRRHFGRRVGLFAGVLATLSPVLWEVDSSGMLDPMGIALLLAALYMYERSPLICGFLLGLASLTHIEFWFLALAVCGFYIAFEKSSIKFIPSILGWLIAMVPYFWFMQTRTGDWLYALKWNYLGSIKGEWISNVQVPFEAQMVPRAVAIGFFVVSVASILYLLKKKQKIYPIHAFFLTFIAMQGVVFGATAYVVPYIAFYQIGRLFLDRLFALNYYYIAVLAPVAIEVISRSQMRSRPPFRIDAKRWTGLLLAAVVALNLSLFPYMTQQYFSETYYGPYRGQIEIADAIVANYRGGTVVSSLVIVNYRLINGGILAENVLGSIYCPKDNIREAYAWLMKHNVTWIIADENMVERFPSLASGQNSPPFYVSVFPILYRVNQTEIKNLSERL